MRKPAQSEPNRCTDSADSGCMRGQCAISVLVIAAILTAGCEQIVVSVEETPVIVVEDKVGRGATAEPGDIVTISYQAKLESGAVALADDQYSFELGANAVIEGIDETVHGMKLGGQRIILCPPQKHWGRAGYGNGRIPPNETLTIDIRLKSIK